MKEAPNSPYNKLVFRETFTNEQSVRRNGGVPTAVTFEKGIGSFNGTSSGIVYNKNFNGTYSIRIRFKEPTSFVSSQHLCDFRKGTGVGYIYCSETTIMSPGGTKYANGVASDSSIAVKEIVVSGMPINSTELTMGRRTAPFTSYFNRDLELFEIYEGTLTDSEVKNLYDNSWAKELSGLNGQTMGNNLMINGTFDTNVDDWTTFRATLTWQLGGFCRLTQNHTANDTMGIQQVGLTPGKRYLITFDAKSPVITSKPGVITAHFSNIIAISNPDLSPNWQKYAYEATATFNLLVLYIPTNKVSPGTVVDADNISVVELQPKLLLDYDSTNGYITDRTGKNNLTLTNVAIKKTGSYYSSEFNGVDSTLITDSTDPTIWQDGFTVVAWINPRSWGGSGVGRIFDKTTDTSGENGLNLFNVTSINRLQTRIAGGALVSSANDSLKTNKWQFVVVTVNASSQINFYIGDLDNAPTLSGTENQTSGLISGITTTNPLTIGNRSTEADRGFDGLIKMAKAYSGVLSLEQLSALWSSTRGKYI